MPGKISSRTVMVAAGLLFLLWLGITCVLARRFNVPSADGLIYSMPFSVAGNPFARGIPFLDNFRGYGETWGHNWPGSMWVKGLFFSVIPFSRVADVALLSIFQGVAAFVATALVWRETKNLLLAGGMFVLVLSDRLLLLACAGNRFESIAVAVVLLLFANTAMGAGTKFRGWPWVTRVSAFICPTLHPYAFAMGLMIVGYDCVAAFQKRRTDGDAWIRLAAFSLGCAAAVMWFIFQPEARSQFAVNLALQKSFYQNWNSVIGGLGNYRLGGGLLLWAAGTTAAGMLATGIAGLRSLSPVWRLLAPALFLAVAGMHTVTRCENFHYLAFGSPFAAMMVAVVAHRISVRRPLAIRVVAICGVCFIVALHGILFPYRLLQFKQAGFPDLQAELGGMIQGQPTNRTIHAPYLFWPCVVGTTANFRWSTFPIASPREFRESYERAAYASAKPGDRLIIDNSSAGEPDRFGVHPTFPQAPPDPVRWTLVENRKILFPGSSAWGVDLSIYEFTGP